MRKWIKKSPSKSGRVADTRTCPNPDSVDSSQNLLNGVQTGACRSSRLNVLIFYPKGVFMSSKRLLSRLGWLVFQGVISGVVLFAGLKAVGIW